MAAQQQIEPGTELAGHRVERLIGRGGMGSVYEAVQISLERRVALKVIAPELGADDEFRERFRHEARAAAAIEHPHLLPVYETGELPGGELFISMRFVEGGDLETRLRALGRLPPAEAVPLLAQLAEALDAAHAAGFVHRDVKPANVLLEGRGDASRAYLADFGLARGAESTLPSTQTGRLLGSLDYMAPEQIADRALDARVDVYAFGGTLYRVLSGQVPYPRDNQAAKLVAHRDAPVPRPSALAAGLDPAFDRAVSWAMAKDRDSRAASAGAVMERLVADLGGSGTRGEAATESIDLGAEARTEEQRVSSSVTSRRPASGSQPPGRAEPAADSEGSGRQIVALVAVFALIFMLMFLLGSRL